MSSPTIEETREYTRRSEKESICMSCYLTVRADRYASLEEAERTHSQLCLMRSCYPLPLGSI